jgi:hypothetical protein
LGAVSRSSIGRKVLVLAIAPGVTLRLWGRINAAARVHHAFRRRGGHVADHGARSVSRGYQGSAFFKGRKMKMLRCLFAV